MFTVNQSSHQSSAFVRGVSVCLALLVFLLGIASVSPQMHEALHATAEHSHCEGHHDDALHATAEHSHCEGHHDDAPEDQNENHSCAVALFDQGATGALLLVELPARTDSVLAVVPLVAEVIYCGQAPIRLCSRGPPIETVV